MVDVNYFELGVGFVSVRGSLGGSVPVGKGCRRLRPARFVVRMGDSMMRRVGFIGLGIMGYPMARNLVNGSGRKLLVWNRDTEKSKQLVSELVDDGEEKDPKVLVADSAKEVLESCDLTYAMLSTPEAVKAVYSEDMMSGIRPGSAFVDCATLTEQISAETASAVRARGGTFLEAPVSGSKVPAEKGQLIFLCAGDRSVFDAVVETDLAAMGKRSFFLGDVGGGTRMKLIVNQLMGTMLASLGEAMTLTQAAGLDEDQLLEILSLGAMENPMFSLKGPGMKTSSRSYPTNFPLEHAQKDMRFAQAMADSLNVSMPIASAANEVYKAAKALGYSRDDFAAVIEASRAPFHKNPSQ
uniref:6-phosphogluconate dehydrogenase NADP-binding domain-containing protein n=1 Tax=Compsopogon caeruleus TaxID=31354 RepID=A0A7S1TEV1_9RHOD|mmetsp:Transcript_4134/g.7950  ORF Transcript_4134/g.7950 Transcript_4134/m.7950 type:complete len:354 (+) Transcript_4134:70-1131(+)